MAKIKVIKSGKESAKPVNYCPWVVDSGDPPAEVRAKHSAFSRRKALRLPGLCTMGERRWTMLHRRF